MNFYLIRRMVKIMQLDPARSFFARENPEFQQVKNILMKCKNFVFKSLLGVRTSVLPVVFFMLLFLAGWHPAKGSEAFAYDVEGPLRNGEAQDPFAALEESYKRALAVERENLDLLERRVERAEDRARELSEIYASHQVMIAGHANLLAAPGIDLQRLYRASMRQRVELGNIGDRLAFLRKNIRELETLKEENEAQIAFYTRQIENAKAQHPGLPVNRNLLAILESILLVLGEKQDKLEVLVDHFAHWKGRFASLREESQRLSARFEGAIQKREQEQILEHDTAPLLRIVRGELAAEMDRLSGRLAYILASRLYYKPEDVRWRSYLVFLGVFLAFFAIGQMVILFLTRYLGAMKNRVMEQQYFYRFLLIQLVQRSLVIGCAFAFFRFYPVPPSYQMTPFFALFPVFSRILLLILGIQWGLVFLRGMRRFTEDGLFRALIFPLRGLLMGIAGFGIVHILIARLYCSDCLLLTGWRILGQLVLLMWTVFFLKVFYSNARNTVIAQYRWFESARPAVAAVCLGIVMAGLVAELAGYRGIAVFWFTGLWHTALVFLWGWILFGFLKEADVPAYIEKSDDPDADEFEEQPYPVRWLLVRVMWIFLAAALLFSLTVAWGAGRGFLADLLYAINFRIQLGDFELSAMGILRAAVVLLVIYTLSVIWKSVLRNRLLQDSDMEEGLKNSITRITVYGLWGMGLVLAMQSLGISGTSLAVVFGALGIGLGFGLQNIFRDFVSGIILLFERSIQVGDVVEIDGTWGIVREINARATYVRTYDNSDLIIPNSDFVSKAVINWSFRDPRIRRRIRVRVAYDADVRKVKETLVDIAYKHPRVLRRPHPEVYIADLGESAMLFELRVWLHISYFITVETEIRDDITNQFRHLGIRIAFPQQDIYIREAPSVTDAVDSATPGKPAQCGQE